MGYREDLIQARDRYAAELAAQQPPPDYSWNEYEEFLLNQLEKVQKLLDAFDANQQQTQLAVQTEVMSGAYT